MAADRKHDLVLFPAASFHDFLPNRQEIWIFMSSAVNLDVHCWSTWLNCFQTVSRAKDKCVRGDCVGSKNFKFQNWGHSHREKYHNAGWLISDSFICVTWSPLTRHRPSNVLRKMNLYRIVFLLWSNAKHILHSFVRLLVFVLRSYFYSYIHLPSVRNFHRQTVHHNETFVRSFTAGVGRFCFFVADHRCSQNYYSQHTARHESLPGIR